MPELSIDYHCKEMAVLAQAGRHAVPEATWHDDWGCLNRKYDVVMVSGSLQYEQNWELLLEKLAGSVGQWFYLTRVPIVEHARTYAAVQRVYGSAMLHWQFNRAAVLKVVESQGLSMDREFEIGDRHEVANAPEPFELRGWLFQRLKSN
jgi:putative methyltransferase (TIGR04325 family)